MTRQSQMRPQLQLTLPPGAEAVVEAVLPLLQPLPPPLQMLPPTESPLPVTAAPGRGRGRGRGRGAGCGFADEEGPARQRRWFEWHGWKISAVYFRGAQIGWGGACNGHRDEGSILECRKQITFGEGPNKLEGDACQRLIKHLFCARPWHLAGDAKRSLCACAW